jgi:hypothetical protein
MKLKKSTLRKSTPKRHYLLVTGEIVFTHGENAIPNAIRCNAVVFGDDSGRIGMIQLAQAQQTLQLQFFQKLQKSEGIKILDVIILGISILGWFTPEEFNKAPEGTVLQEKSTVEVAV